MEQWKCSMLQPLRSYGSVQVMLPIKGKQFLFWVWCRFHPLLCWCCSIGNLFSFIHHGYPVITILNPMSLPTRDNYCTVWEKENVHWITMRVSRFGSKHTLVIQFVHYWIPCSTLISSNVLLPRILEISSMLVTIRVTSDFCYKICNLFTDL